MKKFFKAIAYGHTIPLHEDEIEKVAVAISKNNQGVLILRQGVLDLRSPVHIVPDPEREKKYGATQYDNEKKEIRDLPDAFAELRNKLVESMSLSSGSHARIRTAAQEDVKRLT